MSDTTTTNYGFLKGSQLSQENHDDNLEAIDAAIFANAGGGGGGALQQAEVSISALKMLSGDGGAGSRTIVVPAPGDGFLIYPITLLVLTFPGNVPYGITGGNCVTNWEGTNINDDPDVEIPGGLNSVVVQGDTLKFHDNQLLSAGNNKALCVDIGGNPTGNIVTSQVAPGQGGSGYAPGDTGQLADSDRTYTVSTVGGGGAVLTYTLGTMAPGTEGFTANQIEQTSVSTGDGDGGFEIKVLTVTQGNGTGKVIVTYLVIPTT